MAIIIPEIEIELGENLFLKITDVSFIPATKGVYSAFPENCYPPEPAEADWKDENAMLVIRKFEYVPNKIIRSMSKKIISEKDFPVDESFVSEYYNDIITAIEEKLEGER